MADESTSKQVRKLLRTRKGRVIAGVAGGIAVYFDVDPNLVRFLFILITLLGGSGVLVYIILWVLLPDESSDVVSQEQTVKDNIREMKKMAEHVAEEIKPHTKRDVSREWFAVILIVLGGLFLLQNFGYLWWLSMSKIWPVFLILLGIGILLRKDE